MPVVSLPLMAVMSCARHMSCICRFRRAGAVCFVRENCSANELAATSMLDGIKFSLNRTFVFRVLLFHLHTVYHIAHHVCMQYPVSAELCCMYVGAALPPLTKSDRLCY